MLLLTARFRSFNDETQNVASLHLYTDSETALGFRLEADQDLGAGKCWVVVAPPGPAGCGLLLAQAVTEAEKHSVGRQGAGRVWLFLHTDDFGRDYAALRARGLRFLEAPRREPYGQVAVFEDLYGNKWDLLEPAFG